MSDDSKMLKLEVGHIPASNTVVGYIASIKVLDQEGQVYYAMRNSGLGDMEMLGMAYDMTDAYQEFSRQGRQDVSGGS